MDLSSQQFQHKDNYSPQGRLGRNGIMIHITLGENMDWFDKGDLGIQQSYHMIMSRAGLDNCLLASGFCKTNPLETQPTVSYFDDLDFFTDFENEFPAIVYNDAPTFKSDSLTELILSPQHIDEFDWKSETSLSEYNEEEQNVLCFNDLFPFNVIYPHELKMDTDNDNDKVDIEHSSGDLSVKPLPDVINTDVGAYAHGSNKLLETSINTAYPEEWIQRIDFMYIFSKRRAFWSLNEDILKITILKTNTPYPSRRYGVSVPALTKRPQKTKDQYAVTMDNPNITMEEYIRLEEEKSHRHGKVYNWETATYVFNDALTSEAALSYEPTVSSLNNDEIDFRISFDESDDEDCTPMVSYFDDLDYFKDFYKEFSAIVYNDALTSKIDFLTEPTDNDDDKIDIEHSSGDLSVKLLPDMINTDVGPRERKSTNVGGEFTNLEILKCWSLKTSRRLFNT
ncbi:hypothetical protein Tco_1201530 [Tanacetum coccineum]